MPYVFFVSGVSFLFTFILLALILPFNSLSLAGLDSRASFLLLAILIFLSHVLVAALTTRFIKRNAADPGINK